jgi:hypothetical protein
LAVSNLLHHHFKRAIQLFLVVPSKKLPDFFGLKRLGFSKRRAIPELQLLPPAYPLMAMTNTWSHGSHGSHGKF